MENEKAKKDRYVINDVHKIRVQNWGFGGEGICREAGRLLLLPHAAPGDLVRARVVSVRGRAVRFFVEDVLESSQMRTDPSCEYYRYCPGCRIRHIAYNEQLNYKRRLVREAFRDFAGLDIVPEPTLAASSVSNYRLKADLAMEYRDGVLKAGFYSLEKNGTLLDIRNCPAQGPDIRKLAGLFIPLLRNLPERHLKRLQRLILRSGGSDGSRLVMIKANLNSEDAEEFKSILRNRFVPEDTSMILIGEEGKNDVIRGEPCFSMRLGSLLLEAGSHDWVHSNREMGLKVYEKTLEMISPGHQEIWDFCCGIGGLSLFLAMHGKRVFGVDNSLSAVQQAERNKALNRSLLRSPVIFHAGRLIKSARRHLRKAALPDTVIINPMRVGIGRESLEFLSDLNVKQILYLSPGPGNAARETSVLTGKKYAIEKVVPVDLIPASHHVFTMVSLLRRPYDSRLT